MLFDQITSCYRLSKHDEYVVHRYATGPAKSTSNLPPTLLPSPTLVVKSKPRRVVFAVEREFVAGFTFR